MANLLAFIVGGCGAIANLAILDQGAVQAGSRTRAYEQVCRLSTLTRIGHKKHETPLEFAGRIKQFMPESGKSVAVIADAYTTARYGRKSFNEAEREGIRRAWIDLSRKMVRRLFRIDSALGWSVGTPRLLASPLLLTSF